MSLAHEKQKCPDCDFCQTCSESRCRLCRSDKHGRKRPELGGVFTYAQYMEWKNKIRHEKSPGY